MDNKKIVLDYVDSLTDDKDPMLHAGALHGLGRSIAGFRGLIEELGDKNIKLSEVVDMLLVAGEHHKEQLEAALNAKTQLKENQTS